MDTPGRMWEIDTTEEEFTDLANRVLRHVLQIREPDWRYAQVRDNMLRDLWLPSLTVETLMPTLVTVLRDFYKPVLAGAWDANGVLFRRGERLASAHNWEGLMYDICVLEGGASQDKLTQSGFMDKEWFCSRAISNTNLASRLSYLFVAVGLFLSDLALYTARVEQGDEEWLWRMQAVLSWFDQVCVATHPELVQSVAAR